jgi:hypothetical protein
MRRLSPRGRRYMGCCPWPPPHRSRRIDKHQCRSRQHIGTRSPPSMFPRPGCWCRARPDRGAPPGSLPGSGLFAIGWDDRDQGCSGKRRLGENLGPGVAVGSELSAKQRNGKGSISPIRVPLCPCVVVPCHDAGRHILPPEPKHLPAGEREVTGHCCVSETGPKTWRLISCRWRRHFHCSTEIFRLCFHWVRGSRFFRIREN